MTTLKPLPPLTPPGSPEAVAAGCTCPAGANGRGKGYLGGVKDDQGRVLYVMTLECPLHGGTASC